MEEIIITLVVVVVVVGAVAPGAVAVSNVNQSKPTKLSSPN